ncbi:MAG: hypothetical protein QOI11_1373 [Candidatus Eremiobacteraeota bacterium]|nr:hypothetical protein [Candidatus Eremiobacteraeota bacterium]
MLAYDCERTIELSCFTRRRTELDERQSLAPKIPTQAKRLGGLGEPRRRDIEMTLCTQHQASNERIPAEHPRISVTIPLYQRSIHRFETAS